MFIAAHLTLLQGLKEACATAAEDSSDKTTEVRLFFPIHAVRQVCKH